MMKTFLIPALLICSALCAEAADAPSGAPVLFCAEPTFDFGSRSNTEKVAHTFEVENRGDAVLKITNVKAACGCTVAKVSARELEPGAKATIAATLDLRMRSGRQNKYITVSSNDPKASSMKLTLVGEAVPSIKLTPNMVNFGIISTNESPTRTVKIVANKDQDFTIGKIRMQNNIVEADVKTIKEGREYELSITAKPQSKTGRFSDLVFISTSDRTAGSLRVHATWQIQEPVVYNPKTLLLPESTTDRPVARYLVLRKATYIKEELEITSTTWPGRDDITFSTHKHPALGWRIAIKNLIPSVDMNGEHVVLGTNIPGYEEIKIPVKVEPAKQAK